MNIDKIVFSCSPYFAPFWNLHSKIWKTKMGVHPVCLYFSDTKDGMSEEYGEVILKQTDSRFGTEGDIIQVTMSKFWHPTTEADTVWLIGDIDMLPLQTQYFMEGYTRPAHGDYYHLNFSGIFQSLGLHPSVFSQVGSSIMGGADLAGHYHLATGKTFKDILFGESTLDSVLDEIVFSGKYDNPQEAGDGIHKKFWCAEEKYTSKKLWDAMNADSVRLMGKQYHNMIQRIDRAFWNGQSKTYSNPYTNIHSNTLSSGKFVDIHCHRPYHEQEMHMIELLTQANMIS